MIYNESRGKYRSVAEHDFMDMLNGDDESLRIVAEYGRKLMDRDHLENKKGGTFYTPLRIVQHLVKQGMDIERPPRTLDPACGSGMFLIEAVRQIHAKWPDMTKRHIIKKYIFGMDIDLGAILWADRALQCEAGGQCRTNLGWCDSTTDYFQEWRHHRGITDMEEINKLNLEFKRNESPYIRAWVEYRKKNKDTPGPLGKWPACFDPAGLKYPPAEPTMEDFLSD